MADRGGTTYVWQTAPRRLMGTLPRLNASFLVISPEGDTVATENAKRDGIELTDATQGDPVGTLTDPDRVTLTTGAALSPDASTLAVNDASGRTYLWNTVKRAIIATWRSPGGASNLATFGPGGKILAETPGTGRVYLWDIPSHLLAGSLPVPGSAPLGGLAISPNGKLLAEGSGNSDKVYLWDLSTGEEAAVITDPGGKGTASATFSPDGTMLAIGDRDGSTYLWTITRP
jgi:WD40 repeat protein